MMRVTVFICIQVLKYLVMLLIYRLIEIVSTWRQEGSLPPHKVSCLHVGSEWVVYLNLFTCSRTLCSCQKSWTQHFTVYVTVYESRTWLRVFFFWTKKDMTRLKCSTAKVYVLVLVSSSNWCKLRSLSPHCLRIWNQVLDLFIVKRWKSICKIMNKVIYAQHVELWLTVLTGSILNKMGLIIFFVFLCKYKEECIRTP